MSEVRKFLWNMSIFFQCLMLFLSISFNNVFLRDDTSNFSVQVNENKTYQTITGWGATAGWWAQVAGASDNAEELTKLIYSDEGLGLNIFRYNIGGGERDNPDTRLLTDAWSSTESFLVLNEETGKFEYDWSKDAYAQKILNLALSYGCVDTVVLFANSPHFSMTVTGQASGGFQPRQSNLRKDCYEQYIDYLFDITEHFLDMGVPVKLLSPLNEPQVKWGGEQVYQEGCYYTREEVVEIEKLCAKEIKERNLDIKLSISESSNMGNFTYDYLDDIYENPDIVEEMGVYAYHSYWADGNFYLKEKFGEYVKDKYPGTTLEMTEWCELPCVRSCKSIDAALLMARVMNQDMSITGASAWTSWVPVHDWGGENSDSCDGLIATSRDCNDFYITKRYYAMGHFTKFIPEGSVRISAEKSVDDRIASYAGDLEYNLGYETNVSAYLTEDNEIVVIFINEGDTKTIDFKNVGRDSMTIYTTDETRNLEESYSGATSTVEISPNSINTIIFK